MHFTLSTLFPVALLVVSTLSAPIGERALTPGTVVSARPSNFKNPLPFPAGHPQAGQPAVSVQPHPAIVTGTTANGDVQVAPVSHTEFPPSEKLGTLFPSLAKPVGTFDGNSNVHTGPPVTVPANKVKPAKNGSTATPAETTNIQTQQAANTPAPPSPPPSPVASVVSKIKSIIRRNLVDERDINEIVELLHRELKLTV